MIVGRLVHRMWLFLWTNFVCFKAASEKVPFKISFLIYWMRSVLIPLVFKISYGVRLSNKRWGTDARLDTNLSWSQHICRCHMQHDHNCLPSWFMGILSLTSGQMECHKMIFTIVCLGLSGPSRYSMVQFQFIRFFHIGTYPQCTLACTSSSVLT